MSVGVLVPGKTNSVNPEALCDFAKQVEHQISQSNDGSIQRLICRLMTGKDQKVASFMAVKWVEWRYGKVKDSSDGESNHPVTVIINVPRPEGTASNLAASPAVLPQSNERSTENLESDQGA